MRSCPSCRMPSSNAAALRVAISCGIAAGAPSRPTFEVRGALRAGVRPAPCGLMRQICSTRRLRLSQSCQPQPGHDLAKIGHRYRQRDRREGMTVLRFSALLACALGFVLPAEAQQTKLRATLQLPITDALLGKSLARFKEDVEKRSSGAISVEIFDKGKLYIDDQT